MDAAPWLDRSQLAAWVRVVSLLELLPADLDGQLRRDGGVTMFEYFVLAMLSEAPDRTLRMSELAAQTNSTLPRLSHVVRRMEDRGLVTRAPRPGDRRSTDARLTELGFAHLEAAAPGHVVHVRRLVIDALSPEQISQLTAIADALLARLDPDGAMAATYHRYDQAPSEQRRSTD
ncbi:MarR family winged helix-turn-helix transcriptional regulator [uncultured Pseudokineococcus sp.]|uniref:MarR family winged helix-turn-helix transcriptional regulator n=1 Tax=uncultured Pseudokineococcus sp. TaxID=1642928 RepID=UPI00263580C2|nr:MarR family transcriptional regulator [uncultured Pseudokineococcus sp.]